MSNMAGVFSEVGAACPSRAPGFTPGGSVLLIVLVFCVVFFCFPCLRPLSCVPKGSSFSGLFLLEDVAS